jgi:hypothetical protein
MQVDWGNLGLSTGESRFISRPPKRGSPAGKILPERGLSGNNR